MDSRRLLPIALLVLAASAASVLAAAARDDASRIEGVWSILAIETVTGRVEGQDLKGTLEIRGQKAKINVRMPDREEVKNEYTFVLHPLAEPPAFDVHWADGRITRGIYRFTGDKWIRCHGDPNGPRPANFDNAGANGYVLTIWRRGQEKDEEKKDGE